MEGVEAEAVDEFAEAFAGAGVLLVVGEEFFDQFEGGLGGDFIEEERFGEAGVGSAHAADVNGPAAESADKADVFDAGFGALISAAGDADLEFSGEGFAVVAFVEFQAEGQGILTGTFAELGAGAGFDGTHGGAGHVAGFGKADFGEFGPCGVDVFFFQADEGDAFGGGALNGLGVIFLGDVGEFAQQLRGREAAGKVRGDGIGASVALQDDASITIFEHDCLNEKNRE